MPPPRNNLWAKHSMSYNKLTKLSVAGTFRRFRLFKFLCGSRCRKACFFFVLCVKGAPYLHQDTSGLQEELDPHAGTQLLRKPLDLPSSSDFAATGTESRMETSLPYETCCAGWDPRTIASCMRRFASE